jgi:pimeloyl-ACP methyl ester carboxylesterase
MNGRDEVIRARRLFLLLGAFFAGLAGAVTVEEVTFDSRGVQLSGSLFFPEGSPPKAAIVLVHGSGPTERMSGWANALALNGFATLTYDKRGIGASGGVYEGADNVSSLNLDLLAADAAAAYRALHAHNAVVGVAVGYAGVSQAGWIIPLAAARSPDVAFIVLWSAPVTKVSEELRFSADAGNEWASHEVRAYAERISADDTDPSDSLALLDIPGIWLFGDADTSVSVPRSIERLMDLISQGHDFEYQTFSGYGHNLADFSDPRIKAAITWMSERLATPR